MTTAVALEDRSMLLLLAEPPPPTPPDDREILVLVDVPLRTTVLVVVRITRFRVPPPAVELSPVDISCFGSPIALNLGRCAYRSQLMDLIESHEWFRLKNKAEECVGRSIRRASASWQSWRAVWHYQEARGHRMCAP